MRADHAQCENIVARMIHFPGCDGQLELRGARGRLHGWFRYVRVQISERRGPVDIPISNRINCTGPRPLQAMTNRS